MLDDPQELLEKIQLGEDAVLELKEVSFAGDRVVAPHRDSLADELAAFANSKGGICVLGVADRSREIVGVPAERLDRLVEHVSEICNDSIDPPLVAHIERLALPGLDGSRRAIVKVEVPKSLFVHQSPGGYLLRLGSSKRRMKPDQLARLFQQRSQARLIRFDEQVVPEAILGDLDPPLWERFRSRLGNDDRESLLHKLAMARQDDEGLLRPTAAGVLLATRDPRRFLPNAFIQAVAYRGTEVTPEPPSRHYQLDARDLSGPLDAQVMEACRFVERNMKVAATKHLGRRDFPQYELTAVFEAVVNAVAHRDYSLHGAKIRLRMFADRLELYSPGALVNTMDVDSLLYRQSSRNEAITSLLARCPIPDESWLPTVRQTFMDRRGEGVGLILDYSERLSGRRPVYRLLDDAELCLTVYAALPEE